MKFRRAASEDPEVNLIPLIDVLLVVLIFLAVSTSYARFSQLQLELPSANASAEARPHEIAVGISADGRFQIGTTIVPVADKATVVELLRAAAVSHPDPILVINADAQAPHQSVVTVMEAARDAGVVRLGFAAQHRGGS
jgi:biopolymer transport protein ExbD